MRGEYSEKEALGKAMALCSGAELCASQVEGRLARWGMDEEAQARIVAYLRREGYIDERRFARAYSLDKFRYNGWGRVKIDLLMRRLGIAEGDRAEGLASIDEGEYQRRLTQLLRAKARGTRASTAFELRGKLMRFAMGRGFEAALISRCLPQGMQGEGSDDEGESSWRGDDDRGDNDRGDVEWGEDNWEDSDGND